MTTDMARAIVEAIEMDISDRRGLKWEWAGIDPEVQEEIRQEWVKIIQRIATA